jgi:hypothetical protein
MIRHAGDTVYYVDQPTFQIKVCQRDPHGDQSVQVSPDLAHPGEFESYTFWPEGFYFSETELDACSTLPEIRNLLKRQSRRLARAI